MKLFSTIFLLFFAKIAFAQDVAWRDSTSFDFGEIAHKHETTHVFYFTNLLQDSIEIETVRTDCGCTESVWGEKAIAPGKNGYVKVKFDAYNQGYFKKKLKVYFKSRKKSHKLYITGWVE